MSKLVGFSIDKNCVKLLDFIQYFACDAQNTALYYCEVKAHVYAQYRLKARQKISV
jgi:hypothetical protein